MLPSQLLDREESGKQRVFTQAGKPLSALAELLLVPILGSARLELPWPVVLLCASPFKRGSSDLSFLCVCTCVCLSLGHLPLIAFRWEMTLGISRAPARSGPLPLFSSSPLPPPFAFCSLSPPLRLLFSSSSSGSALFLSNLCLQSNPWPWLCFTPVGLCVLYTFCKRHSPSSSNVGKVAV